jgi:hypothetical protein
MITVDLGRDGSTRPAWARPAVSVSPEPTTTLTDILADVLERQVVVSKRDGRAGPDVLRRVSEASALILISLGEAGHGRSG